ncbi:MAG: ABC transporter substrate-binding protein, partial [Firmicutes bacterium]|nr:ABC transporter substrate-binding protein [Bacillota bacterium]
MKNKGLLIAIAVIAIAVVVYFAFFTGDSTNDENTIKIGFIGPLTGSAAAYGVNARNGAIIAIDQINADGGVLDGRKIELIIQDDKGD